LSLPIGRRSFDQAVTQEARLSLTWTSFAKVWQARSLVKEKSSKPSREKNQQNKPVHNTEKYSENIKYKVLFV